MPDLDPFFFKINSWSFTKHRVWNRCQRQYYFEYIAQYVKSNSVVNPEKIRWLKNFKSKFVVQGSLIHDIIDQQIQIHCENKPLDLNDAMNAFSKKVSLYKNIGGETFTEYHNGEKIPNSFYDYIEENGKTCLHTFFGKWADYKSRECLRHEEFDHFSIGNVGVTVKVDFIGKMPDDTLILTDWKTGRDDDEYETELQMAAYVLWAKEYYKVNADEISSELVFLKTGATKPFAFFDEQLREVQELITREFEMMNASYEYGDFPARPSQRECLSCKFAEVCPDSAIVKTR
jgi:CRISPR/Cas system-associated exonuclease Cas4 (RecB family)